MGETETRELVLRLDERVQTLQKEVEKLGDHVCGFNTTLSEGLIAHSAASLTKIEEIKTASDTRISGVEVLTQSNREAIVEYKRDRTWMYGIFIALWAGVVAWIKFGIKPS